MVITTEVNPCGYQQQTYPAFQEGWSSGDGHNTSQWGMQVKPYPSSATPHHYANHNAMQQYDGGREGWHGNNKHHQNGWQHNASRPHHGYGTSEPHHGYAGSGGQMLQPYNCNNNAAPGGKYMNSMPSTEYRKYHEVHAPMAPSRVEVVEYEYRKSGNGCPSWTSHDQNSGGMLGGGGGYKEWIVKGINQNE